MPTEIERKFLVSGDGWKQPDRATLYRQGYLSTDKDRTVRVRIAGERAFLTIKGRSSGISRAEFEYEIPVAEAAQMLDTLCFTPLIEKLRYVIDHEGHRWEVDEFLGENQGLVVAEVELASPDEKIVPPSWLGREVSDDPRYFNSNLIKHPYRTW